ncbi:MAG: TraR/DksA C4-type zinc finger protein [Tepidanaerobacteraceae bacterium]
MTDYHRYQMILDQLKAELESRVESFNERSSLPLKDSVGELSSYDNHSPDLAAETFEKSKDIGLRDREKIILTKVNHALDQIKDGSYGKCERCGKDIEEERLEAVPYTTRCTKCKKTEEESNDKSARPIEEDILRYPFGRSFLDDADQNEYDGEDAWQDVARYGTSNSPQDEPGAVDYSETYVDEDEERGTVERADKIIADDNRTR